MRRRRWTGRDDARTLAWTLNSSRRRRAIVWATDPSTTTTTPPPSSSSSSASSSRRREGPVTGQHAPGSAPCTRCRCQSRTVRVRPGPPPAHAPRHQHRFPRKSRLVRSSGPDFLYSFRFKSLLLTKDVVCWQGIELRRPPRRTRTQDCLSRVGPPRSRSGTTLPWSCCYCWWWRWGRRSWCTAPRRRLAPLQRSSSRQQRRGRGRQLEPPDDRLAQAEARSDQGRVGVAGWTRFGDGRCRSHSRRYR